MTGSNHSKDMLMSDSIDTAACSFQNRQARSPPGSLNTSAQDVNHVSLLGDQRELSEQEERKIGAAEVKR